MTARIRLFGVPRVEHSGRSHPRRHVTLTETSAALLAYLLLNGKRSHNRSALVGRFWGDSPESSARACLNTTLWRLRRALEPEGVVARGAYLHAASRDSVSFNWDSPWWVDALELERSVEHAIATRHIDIGHLESAVDLYRSCLLEGHDDPWVTRERDRFEGLQLEGLTMLLDHYAGSGDHRAALACGRQILCTDPLREDVHRTMMRVYSDQGQRSMVVRQYRWCVSVLAQELSISPLEETEGLYLRLVGTKPSHQGPAAAAQRPRSRVR